MGTRTQQQMGESLGHYVDRDLGAERRVRQSGIPNNLARNASYQKLFVSFSPSSILEVLVVIVISSCS